MPIKRLTPPEEINRYIAEGMERRKQALIRSYCIIGEQVVNHARSLPSLSAADFKGRKIPPHQPNYIDWTANLRSSIGYIVSLDGEIVQMSSFDVVKEGGEGAKGGKEYAMQLVRDFPKGIVLIVVAGMNYASYVSAKGYDVLDSSELLADKLSSKIKKQFGLK